MFSIDFLVDGEHKFGEVAFENSFEVVPGNADAVIGEAVLGVVVGADLLGAHPAAHSGSTGGFEFAHPFFLLQFPELGAEEIETDLAIALLVALLGRDSSNTRGLMDQPNGGRDLVDVLATMTTGTEKLPF